MENGSKVAQDVRPSGDIHEMAKIEDSAIAEYANEGVEGVESYLNSTAGRLQGALEARYNLVDIKYNQNDQARYDKHTDEIVGKLSEADAAFAGMDDAARDVFGKGVAAALYNNDTQESKTAALREVISLYRESHTVESSLVEETESTQEVDKPTPTTKLGRFAAKVSNIFDIASGATGAGFSTVADRQAAKGDKLKARLAQHEIDEQDDGRTRLRKKLSRYAIYGSGIVTSAAAMWMLAPIVGHATGATVDIVTGGRTDGTSTGLANVLQGAGWTSGETKKTQYDAQIFPLDTGTLDQSKAQSSQSIYDNAQAARAQGKTVEITSHSEGTVGANNAANRLAVNGVLPEDVKVTQIGSPMGEGLGKNDIVRAVAPILKSGFGIDIFEDSPAGVHYMGKINDIWTTENGRSPAWIVDSIVGTFAGDGHNYTSKDLSDGSMHYMITKENGDTYTTILTPEGQLESGIARAAAANNMKVNKSFDDFVMAATGKEGAHYGDGSRANIDGSKVVSTGGAALKDTLRDNGVDSSWVDPATQVAQGFAPVLEKVAEAANDTLYGTAQTAAEANGTGGGTGGTSIVESLPQQVQQPVQQFVQQSAPAVQEAVKTFVPPAQQAQVNGLLKGFGLVK